MSSKLSDAIKKLSEDEPAQVTPATYTGVSVDHPSIVSAIKNMAKDGRKLKEIMKVVGMPAEVVRRHASDVKE